MTEIDTEAQAMQEELEHFRTERDKVRALVGQIGGKGSAKRDKLMNIVFITLVLMLFTGELLARMKIVDWGLEPMDSMGLAVLLVSLKIIWMIHQQSRVEHFQFWILNTIEFRLTDLAKNIRTLQNTVNEALDSSD